MILAKALLLAAILLPGTAAAAKDALTQPDQSLLQHVGKPYLGDFDGMRKRGFVRILTAYNPIFFTYGGPTQKKRGIVVDAAEEFEKHLNKLYGEKGRHINVILIPVPRDQILPRLVAGRGDIAIANLTITPERRKLVDFSPPNYPGVKELVVTGPAASAVKSFDDLAAVGVYVRKSSSYHEHLVALNGKRKASGKPEIPIRLADENLEDYDLLDLVNTGITPAIIVDSHKAALWVQVFKHIRVHEDLAVNSGGDIAWAFRKDSPKLAAVVNRFTKEHRKGTALGNILIKRYLGDIKWMDNPASSESRARFARTVDFIRKYAKLYDFDWLMIAAQGYQESQLDQNKRSKAGAIGIMQVMPKTAADPKVGIPDIQEAEQNVHAGVKYLRFIRNRYFSALTIAPLESVLFSFAAYNAGPAAITRARKRATQMKLNPNVWFNNVEVAAAQTISKEPVVYVRNIYKYYVAYRQMAAVQASRSAAGAKK